MAKRTRRTLIVSKPTLDAALSEPGGLNKLMDKAPDNRPDYPRALAVAGHYMLWRTGAALYVINDERCPRAHAHTVWSGTDADAAWDALRQLADSDVTLTPCVRA